MRKGELILNFTFIFGPLVLGFGSLWAMGLAQSMPRSTFWAMIGLFLAGFALFAKAKLSIIKQGHLFTFGPSKMSKVNRFAYFLGYAGMGLGLFLLNGFALAVEFC